MIRTALSSLVIAVVAASAASAQTTAPAAPQMAPTAPAVQAPSAAPTASPGTNRQLSPEAKARWEAFQAACGADLKSHCSGVARGTDAARHEMRQCVETHKVKFSPACQAAITERAARREAQPAKLEEPSKPKG